MPPTLSGFLVDVLRLVIWLVILAIIFLPVERWFALHPRERRRPGVAIDLGFYFLSGLLPAVVLSVPMALLVALAHRIQPTAYQAWITDLPLWAKLVAGLVIGEIGFYWGHRWTHEVPALWRFHAIHHVPEHMDWLVNTRAHPVDMVFVRLCGLVPLYLLGLAGNGGPQGNVVAMVLVLVGTAWGFLIHANVRWRFGPLEHAIATPAFHHWHHTRDEQINRNFASMLPVLDRVFGTLHLPARAWPKAYGIGEGSPPATPVSDPATAPAQAGASGGHREAH